MRYDFYCEKDSLDVRDVVSSLSDPAPKCPLCGESMERLFDEQKVYFRGFTTPGGNGK